MRVPPEPPAADQRDRQITEDLRYVLRRTRRPVDRVLQEPRNAPVVLGRRKQQAVRRPQRILQLGDPDGAPSRSNMPWLNRGSEPTMATWLRSSLVPAGASAAASCSSAGVRDASRRLPPRARRRIVLHKLLSLRPAPYFHGAKIRPSAATRDQPHGEPARAIFGRLAQGRRR